MRPARFLSLFSGAGGMDVGLERAGFEPDLCLELDATARSTLRENRPEWPVDEQGDVIHAARALVPGGLGIRPGELDLIAGGPPCQPFSKASQWASTGRQGMGDVRAGTVHALLDLVETFLPRAVLLENVQGFIAGPSSAWAEIQARFDRIGERTGRKYRLHSKVINTADFGIPQNRRRAVVVALEEGADWLWPEATHAGDPITAWDSLADLHEPRNLLPEATGKWANLLPSIPEGWNYQWLTREGGGEELFGYRTRYWNFLLKLARDRPAWTIPASPGPSAGPFHWENRPLSIRERLRLQSFPDEWRLVGSFRDQSKLAGNATPPLLAEIMGLAIRTALGLDVDRGTPTLQRGRSRTRPAPTVPAPVHPTFRHLAGEKAAHGGTGRGPAPVRQRDSEMLGGPSRQLLSNR